MAEGGTVADVKIEVARAKCEAKTRAGRPCRLPAGWATDHVGFGRCKLHGGATPAKHGRYSKIPSKAVREILAELEQESEEEQLNILPEAMMLRALAQDYIARFNETKDSLLAWNAEEYAEATADRRKPRPQRIPDLHEAASLLEAASRVVEKVHRREAQNAISRNDFYRVMGEMGRVVDTLIDDQETKRQIKESWLSIRV
jgi:hypothetical protein